MSDFVRCKHQVHGGEADISAAAFATGFPQARGWRPVADSPPPESAKKAEHVAFADSLGLPTDGTKQQVMDRITAHADDLPTPSGDLDHVSGEAGESEQDNG